MHLSLRTDVTTTPLYAGLPALCIYALHYEFVDCVGTRGNDFSRRILRVAAKRVTALWAYALHYEFVDALVLGGNDFSRRILRVAAKRVTGVPALCAGLPTPHNFDRRSPRITKRLFGRLRHSVGNFGEVERPSPSARTISHPHNSILQHRQPLHPFSRDAQRSAARHTTPRHPIPFYIPTWKYTLHYERSRLPTHTLI